MFFFGKNLRTKHKVILCLVVVSILTNYLTFTHLSKPFVEYLPNGEWKNINMTKVTLSFGILVKMLVVAFFRKF